MYDKLFEQTDVWFKPFNELLTANLQALDDLNQKQISFITKLMDESLGYSKTMAESKDMESLYSTQKACWQSIQDKMTDNAKESFVLITDAQKQFVDLCETSFASFSSAVEKEISDKMQLQPNSGAVKKAKRPAAKKKAVAKPATAPQEEGVSESSEG